MASPNINQRCYLLSSDSPGDYTYVRKWLKNHGGLHDGALEVQVTRHIKDEYTRRIARLEKEIASLKEVESGADPHAKEHAKEERKLREREHRDAVRRRNKAGLGKSTIDKCFQAEGGTRKNQEAIRRFILSIDSIDESFKNSLLVAPRSQLGQTLGESVGNGDANLLTPVQEDDPAVPSGAREPAHPAVQGRRFPSARCWAASAAVLLLILAAAYLLWPSSTEADVALNIVVLPKDSQTPVPLEAARMPITFGDAIRFEIQASAKRRLYLFWLDACGDLQPLWPWEDFDWDRPVETPATESVSFPQDAHRHFTLRPSDIEGCSGHGIHTVFAVSATSPIDDFEPLRRAIRVAGYAQEGLAPDHEELRCRVAEGALLTLKRQAFGPSEERAVLAVQDTRDARSPVSIVRELLAEGAIPGVEDIDAVCFAVGDRFEP